MLVMAELCTAIADSHYAMSTIFIPKTLEQLGTRLTNVTQVVLYREAFIAHFLNKAPTFCANLKGVCYLDCLLDRAKVDQLSDCLFKRSYKGVVQGLL